MAPVEAALALAESGVPVFACRADKRPATANGFKAATTDAAAIQTMFRRSVAELVGVPTGPAPGLDVLDIDPRHGGDAWWSQWHSGIGRTRVHATRSGGLHALFRHAPGVRNTASIIAPGVDTRGEGGYVIWWPAHGCAATADAAATWPTWLLRRFLRRTPTRHEASARPIRIAGEGGAERIARASLARLRGASEGQRHYQLCKAAVTVGGLLHILGIGRERAAEALVDAAAAAGAEDLNGAKKTALSGLAKGEASPLTVERADA